MPLGFIEDYIAGRPEDLKGSEGFLVLKGRTSDFPDRVNVVRTDYVRFGPVLRVKWMDSNKENDSTMT